MSLTIWKNREGISDKGPLQYEATTEDPWLSYRFVLRRPRFMVVLLEGPENFLEPKIYFNRGNGYDEAKAISVKCSRGCILSIAITPPYKISSIRIDPSSTTGNFRYWAGFAWTDEDRSELVAQANRHAQGVVTLEEISIDGTPEKKTGTRIADHYASVVALAERTVPLATVPARASRPFISFVAPVFNSPTRYLDDLYRSFLKQPAGLAELIFVNDGSTRRETVQWLATHSKSPNVHVLHNEKNAGIVVATNLGVAKAAGEWLSFIDHDDALSPGAVQLIAKTASDHPDCKFIYTDEVVTNDQLKPVGYFFKPAYNDVLLSGVNYINHLSCYKRDRLLAMGALRTGFDGSQDYDLLLRYLKDLSDGEIKHLPYPAYLWRRTKSSYSAKFAERATAAARKALGERYRGPLGDAVIDEALTKTLHRVRFDLQHKAWPRVSVVIPNKDSPELIASILNGLVQRTDYPNLEIVVVDNGTKDPRVLEIYREASRGAVRFIFEIKETPFNFSRQVNRGIELASGNLILLLNNDIEVTDAGWLREMVSCFSYPRIGVVGARLLYPSRRVQHAGVVVGLGGLAGHLFGGVRENYPGPMARLHVRQTMTAVTGACMMVSRDCLEKVGRFDEEAFGVAYNDIDFCLRAVTAGYRVVWTPFATLIHHESLSRGSDERPENRARFQKEKDNLRSRHHTDTFDDPAFSPWYTRDRSEPVPVMLDHIPPAR